MWERMSDEGQNLWTEVGVLIGSETSDGESRFLLPHKITDYCYPLAEVMAQVSVEKQNKFNPASKQAELLTVRMFMAILWGVQTYLKYWRIKNVWSFSNLVQDETIIDDLKQKCVNLMTKPADVPLPVEESLNYFVQRFLASRKDQKHKITKRRYRSFLEMGIVWGYYFAEGMVIR